MTLADYVSTKEIVNWLASIENSVSASVQRLEDYIEKRRGRLITATRNNTDDTRISRMEMTRKQKWEEKELYGCFKRLTRNISPEKTWTWQKKGNLKREIESLLIAAQNNVISSNHIKARIDKTQENSRCKLCGDIDETITHILSECGKLGQREYKTKCDWVGKVIHRELCRKFQFGQRNKWYMHKPASLLKNETHKLLWAFDIQTEQQI